MAPYYSKQYLNTFLVGTKDKEAIIRTSSISNLGQFCKVISFSLGPFITEIISCIQAVLKHDESLDVKRSTVMFLYLMLSGINKRSIKVFISFSPQKLIIYFN